MTLALEEVIDLELLSTLDPHCEDDHHPDDDWPAPACTTIAVGRFIWDNCQWPTELVCRAMMDWFYDSGILAECSSCGPGCLRAEYI